VTNISRNKIENAANIAGSDATPIKWEIDWKNQQSEQEKVKPFV